MFMCFTKRNNFKANMKYTVEDLKELNELFGPEQTFEMIVKKAGSMIDNQKVSLTMHEFLNYCPNCKNERYINKNPCGICFQTEANLLLRRTQRCATVIKIACHVLQDFLPKRVAMKNQSEDFKIFRASALEYPSSLRYRERRGERKCATILNLPGS